MSYVTALWIGIREMQGSNPDGSRVRVPSGPGPGPGHAKSTAGHDLGLPMVSHLCHWLVYIQ